MDEKVKAIPDGYSSITPYLIVKGAAEAIAFYVRVFGATERLRLPSPVGGVGHAEISVGNSVIMLADEFPDMGALSPQSLGGTPVSLMLYVDDVDTVFARALAAGARELRAVEHKFYGDRLGQVEDPFGHVWSLATHVEDVPPEDLPRRMAAAFPSDTDMPDGKS